MWHDAGQTSEVHTLVVFACFWKLGKAHVLRMAKKLCMDATKSLVHFGAMLEYCLDI